MAKSKGLYYIETEPRRRHLPATMEGLIRAQDELRSAGCLFLLGAGASADAGVPTATQLASRVLRRLDREETRLCSRVLANLDAPEQGKATAVDIETLLLCLEMLSSPESDPLFPFVSEWNLPVRSDSFRREILRLHRRIWNLVVPLLRPTKPLDYLRQLGSFKSRLTTNRGGRQWVTQVFTLNHDRTVEQAVPSCRTFFDEREWPQIDRAFDPTYYPASDLWLYKLHGSVDWRIPRYRGEHGGRIVKIDPPAFKHTARAVSANMYGSRRHPYFDLHGGALKGMILGERDKGALYDPYLYLQRRFNEELSSALVLFVMGYSWRDEYVNAKINLVKETPSAAGVVVVDVTRKNAIEACNGPRGQAHVIIGGGVKNALMGGVVSVALAGEKAPQVFSRVEGGLIGALRELAANSSHSDFFSSFLKAHYRGTSK